MAAVAEVMCPRCGVQRSRTIPAIARPLLVPLCECGARPKVVRVFRARSQPGGREASRPAPV